MNIDCSKYCVGSRTLTADKVAYKNGQKLEEKPKLADTLVIYDFGQGTEKVTVNSKEEFSRMMSDIKEQHGEGVMVSISGLGLDFLEIKKGLLENGNASTRVAETEALTPEMRAEVLQKAMREMELFGDDERNLLNHSFVNEGFSYEKDFEKAAYGYAKYLNQEMETAYDEDIFYNLQDEELYREEVSRKMYGYASNVLSYFRMGAETEEEKMSLSNQLADAAIQYAKNLAVGKLNIDALDTKLKIGDAEICYSELHKIQETLQNINETGVRAVHSSDSESRLNYLGLGSNYDTVAYAQLGLRTAQVNYFAETELSKDAAMIVKNVWAERTEQTIEEKYVKPLRQMNEVLKEHFTSLGDYYKAGSLQSNYAGSKLEKVYEMFAKVGGSSQEEFLESFEAAMTEYNEYRMSKAFYKDGYVGTEAEMAQLAYLEGTKGILFE